MGQRHNTDHARIRAWLKGHGHSPADVDREVTAVSTATRAGTVAALCRLHGTTIEEYERCAIGPEDGLEA